MRFTTSDGKKAAMVDSKEAYKKLMWYENDEERGVIPEEYMYGPDRIQSKDKGKFFKENRA